ncbi:MAG: hypothetical protein AAFR90_14095 [Pseudomonadota bacterium]
MIGGLIKSSSRIALVAVAGVAFGGVAAQAADLGGDCCADLEERVAELEATTARKGNRKVSLTVSGRVNQAVMFWSADEIPAANRGGNDQNGEGSNIYTGTNSQSISRFTFKGKAQINADWSAGYLMEFGVTGGEFADAAAQDTDQSASGIEVRHEALYIKSKTFGTMWLGQTSTAADGITEISLGGGMGSGPDFSNETANFLTTNGVDTFSDVGGGSQAGEGSRRNVVKYVSPTFAGFVFSGSAGEDDYWDAALRYAGEFGTIRVAAGVAYSSLTEGTGDGADTELGASASISHVPTGIYLTGMYGIDEDEADPAGQQENSTWYVEAGIGQKFLPVGKTTFWGMYGVSDTEEVNDGELTYYGVGFSQDIDAAAMETYIYYKRFDAEIGETDVGSLDVLMAGAVIKF